MKGNSATYQGMRGKVGSLVVSQQNGVAVVRARNFVNSSRTQSQQAQKAQVMELGRIWRTLEKATSDQWVRLGLLMRDLEGKRRKPFLSGYQAFVAVNGTRMLVGDDVLIDAPATVNYPAILPTITVEATRSGGSGGAFALKLHSDAYSGRVLLLSAPPVNAGRNYFSNSSFRPLGTLETLTAGATVVTTLYVNRFGNPAAGQQIALRVVPISADGFRGIKYTVTGIIAVVGAEASEQTDDTLHVA